MKWIDKIYNRYIQPHFNLSKQENEEYLKEAVRRNKYSFKVLVIIMFIFEFYNMLHVLVFTNTKLGTLDNRIYFTMYVILFVSGIIFLIVEYYMRNNVRKLNYLYMGISFSWFLWHVVINYYDLTNNTSSGIVIYMVATLTCAIFFQCKPSYGIFLNITFYIIFTIVTYNIVDSGAKLNLLVVAMMSIVILTKRYQYLIQMLRANNDLHNMNDEIQRKKSELQISLQKQKVIMEYTNDILIEWNSKRDILSFSNNVQNKFLCPILINNAREWIKTTSDIHPNDIGNVIREVQQVIDLKKEGGINVRIREKNGNYVWYQARLFVQIEEVGSEISIIGILTDVDKQQRQIEKLLLQSSRDLLTGLYNKISTEKNIEELLRNNVNGTMYMIDIDNFKDVNDTLGHAMGDQVIVEVANVLKGIFYKDDIIGRIGGDEFLVFCSRLENEDNIISKAEQVLQSLKRTYSDEYSSVSISVSMGVYLGTKEDKGFKDLYIKADNALYTAKERGKNQFCFLV